MKLTLLFIILVFISYTPIYGQTRTITGRVVTEDLLALPGARVQKADTLLLGTTDINGTFRVEIPADTKALIISAVGMEWQSIHLPDSCDHLDIILLNSGHYDFMSARKVDRLRKKQFQKLPQLHQAAYLKGLFSAAKPCYKQAFVPIKES